MTCEKEQSEREIGAILEKTFGKNDVEPNPKVGDKRADFRIKIIDTYVEVHAIKNIALDQLKITVHKNNIRTFEFKKDEMQDGQAVVLDKIASKLLHECIQLPENKKNLIVTKTEGFFIDPDDIIDAIIGQPYLLVEKETMEKLIKNGADFFRTKEELDQVLHKISAIIAYDRVCQHGKLVGLIGNNRNNAMVPFDEQAFEVFHRLLCDKCC